MIFCQLTVYCILVSYRLDMKIAGLQKLTLLDYPEHTACTVFLPGCNFRCHYCHNAELVLPECISEQAEHFIDEAEFFAFLEERKGLLEGVCVTGGEPTIHPGLRDFLRKIKAMGFKVKLDTNGSSPKILEKILAEKLVDYVAMDVKAAPEQYAEFVGISGQAQADGLVSAMERSRDLIASSGIDYEFRTTLINDYHDEAEFAKILEFVRNTEKLYLQNFSSATGCLDEEWNRFGGFSDIELQKRQQQAQQYVRFCGVRT